METKNIVDKINKALENIEMPQHIRKLLIELRDDIPHAKTPEDKQAIFLRWGQLIMTAMNVVSNFFK